MEDSESGNIFDLEYFFDMSPALLCVAGYDGYFKKINPAVSKTLDYTMEELFASPVNSFVHPDDKVITALKHKKMREGEPLLNFENRYVSKNGVIVWLSWISMPIKRDQLVFAIAQNITYKKQLNEYDRISAILGAVISGQNKSLNGIQRTVVTRPFLLSESADADTGRAEPLHGDQEWLNKFESIVRKHTGKLTLKLSLISDELALSERQLFRKVDRILGITPNKLVRIVRLQLAWEAIASGKYQTIKEISHLSGYQSRGHFTKIFKEVYGINVSELI